MIHGIHRIVCTIHRTTRGRDEAFQAALLGPYRSTTHGPQIWRGMSTDDRREEQEQEQEQEQKQEQDL